MVAQAPEQEEQALLQELPQPLGEPIVTPWHDVPQLDLQLPLHSSEQPLVQELQHPPSQSKHPDLAAAILKNGV